MRACACTDAHKDAWTHGRPEAHVRTHASAHKIPSRSVRRASTSSFSDCTVCSCSACVHMCVRLCVRACICVCKGAIMRAIVRACVPTFAHATAPSVRAPHVCVRAMQPPPLGLPTTPLFWITRLSKKQQILSTKPHTRTRPFCVPSFHATRMNTYRPVPHGESAPRPSAIASSGLARPMCVCACVRACVRACVHA